MECEIIQSMDAAHKENQVGISTRESGQVVYIPTQEESWRDGVTGHAQKLVPSHTKEQATPPAAQPVPGSKDLDQAGAERVGAEPIIGIDIADITDIMGKTTGHAVESVGREEGLLTHGETVPGSKAVSFIKEKMRRFKGRFLKKAA